MEWRNLNNHDSACSPIGLGRGLPIGRSSPHYTYAARPTGKLTSIDTTVSVRQADWIVNEYAYTVVLLFSLILIL